MIPHIIHQTAPSDKSKWSHKWYECQESWKKQFPNFEYMMWTDEDNLNLITADFPWFLDTYNKYPKNINRIDIVRYFILYKYGGIYADMDYMCIKNFFNEIPKNKISISESPFIENEFIQNALMISPKNHDFWLKVIKESKRKIDNNENIHDVLDITGPRLLSNIYYQNKDTVNILPIEKYNPNRYSDDFNNHDKIFTKHLCTSVWFNYKEMFVK